MDQTFMTIHNLGPDANILFASESIADILGYLPSEVQGKSCFDYFHPDEVPFARSVHSRGVLLDKAAVLHYARILSRDGRWVGCECCFTIVHDVLVACTSIYRRNAKSETIEAPQIRRIFSCSPRDPRYHMLEHLSPKFKMSPMEREPRAALILNRFTRNLTIMFATTSITSVLGLRPNEIKHKGFYRCIQENCLPEAIQCLESAKANDSIAYLRFFFQDPREDDELADAAADNGTLQGRNEEMPDAENLRRPLHESPPHGSSHQSVDMEMGAGSIVDIKIEETDAHISMPALPLAPQANSSAPPSRLPSIELEAVVSCTSDGLVVILRKARPPIPPAHPPLVAFDYGDGLFAAPWGQQPIRPSFPHESLYTFRPPLLPQYMPLRDNVKDAGGPPLDVLMGSIRDVAVFAWGVVGINPAMAAYGRGLPSGEARPVATGSRQGYQQTRQEVEDPANSSVNSRFTSQSKGKAADMFLLAGQQHGYSSGRPRPHASYNALDPVVGSASGSSCSFQSTWSGMPGSGWNSSRYYADATPSSATIDVGQQPSGLEAPLASNSLPLHPSLPPQPLSRNAGCPPPAYNPSSPQNSPQNTTENTRGYMHDWR